MINILNCKKKNYKINLNKLLKKRERFNNNKDLIQKIIKDIRNHGDKALIKYEKKYSNNSNIITQKKDLNYGARILNSKVKRAIDFSFQRIFLHGFLHCHQDDISFEYM